MNSLVRQGLSPFVGPRHSRKMSTQTIPAGLVFASMEAARCTLRHLIAHTPLLGVEKEVSLKRPLRASKSCAPLLQPSTSMDPKKLNAALLRDYTDFHLLGEGGFGKVYLATCAATGEVRQFRNTLLFG